MKMSQFQVIQPFSPQILHFWRMSHFHSIWVFLPHSGSKAGKVKKFWNSKLKCLNFMLFNLFHPFWVTISGFTPFLERLRDKNAVGIVWNFVFDKLSGRVSLNCLDNRFAKWILKLSRHSVSVIYLQTKTFVFGLDYISMIFQINKSCLSSLFM